MTWTFLAADLVTGTVLDELPLQVSQSPSRTLMDQSTGAFTLPVTDTSCPTDWENLTRPWRSMIIVVSEAGEIVWGGIPTVRARPIEDPVIEFSCVTAEGYLDRRHVPTLTFRGKDQTSDIALALARVADPYGIGLDYDCPDSGVVRDRDYYGDEGATVLKRLQQLASVINGFEWTIDVVWDSDSQTRVRKVFRTGYRHIGHITETPDPWFEVPGSIIDGEVEESWSGDDGATHVTAVGDGEGDSKVISAPSIDITREAAGWPRLETRRSFSSVTEQATINAHAVALGARLFGGQHLVTVSVRPDEYPRFGDWGIGDSVGIKIETDTVNLREVWRIVGWEVGGGNIPELKPTIALIEEPIADEEDP